MANNYLQAAFAVTVTASEARLIAAVQRAIRAIDSGVEGDEATAFVADLGPEFATAFPGGDADPFAGVMTIFRRALGKLGCPDSSKSSGASAFSPIPWLNIWGFGSPCAPNP